MMYGCNDLQYGNLYAYSVLLNTNTDTHSIAPLSSGMRVLFKQLYHVKNHTVTDDKLSTFTMLSRFTTLVKQVSQYSHLQCSQCHVPVVANAVTQVLTTNQFQRNICKYELYNECFYDDPFQWNISTVTIYFCCRIIVQCIVTNEQRDLSNIYVCVVCSDNSDTLGY